SSILFMGRARLFACAFVALFACREAMAPLSIGQPYILTLINEQLLPFTLPVAPPAPPAMIVYGSITIINDSIAERRERISESSDPSVPPISDWTFAARYHRLPRGLVLQYSLWAPVQGPRQPVATT